MLLTPISVIEQKLKELVNMPGITIDELTDKVVEKMQKQDQQLTEESGKDYKKALADIQLALDIANQRVIENQEAVESLKNQIKQLKSLQREKEHWKKAAQLYQTEMNNSRAELDTEQKRTNSLQQQLYNCEELPRLLLALINSQKPYKIKFSQKELCMSEYLTIELFILNKKYTRTIDICETQYLNQAFAKLHSIIKDLL